MYMRIDKLIVRDSEKLTENDSFASFSVCMYVYMCIDIHMYMYMYTTSSLFVALKS